MRVNLGSRGPWLQAEDFKLDYLSYSTIFSKNLFTVDAISTYKTRQVERYYSAAFELEALAVDFFAQRLSREEFYWVSFVKFKDIC